MNPDWKYGDVLKPDVEKDKDLAPASDLRIKFLNFTNEGRTFAGVVVETSPNHHYTKGHPSSTWTTVSFKLAEARVTGVLELVDEGEEV